MGGRAAHLGHSTTGAVLSTGKLAVMFSHQTKLIKEILGKCVTCIKLFKSPGSVFKTSSRALEILESKTSFPIFSCISWDPIGPFRRRCSRKTFENYFLLIVSCLTTGAVNIRVLDNLKMENIARAVSSHVTEFGYPKIAYVDKGTSVNICMQL